jgi:hypothetical protein
MVATAFIASHRSGGEALAQSSGTERRIVSAGVYGGAPVIAYRIWSDNSIDLRPIAWTRYEGENGNTVFMRWGTLLNGLNGQPFSWQAFDNGTSGFRPITDVDMSGETDAGDISQVLMDFNTRSEDLPPPPIDCNINRLR